MTKDRIKQIEKLRNDNEFFREEMTIEELLYEAIISSDIAHVIAVLQMTDWSKWCPNTKFKGKKNESTIQKITIVEDGKPDREIDFQETDFDNRVNTILRYL